MTNLNYFLLVFCFVFLIIKFISIYATNFDLFGDEAQYWLWSQNIELGYFSKPPLLSWTVALVCLIFGNNIFVIKMISIILYCVTSYIIYLISYKLNKNVELAFLTAITFFVMPAVSVSSFLLSTDILLVFFWSLALLQLLIIKEKPTAASPDTKEQLLLHASVIWYQGEKLSFPPNCNMSPGLALPHIFFKKRLTIIHKLKTPEIHKNIISLKLNLYFM